MKTMLQCGTLLLVTGRLAVVSAGDIDSTTTVSIFGFEGIMTPSGLAESLQEHLESCLLSHEGYEVLSRNDMDKILRENSMQLSGLCREQGCLVETGTILGVEKLVTGTISRVGATYNIVLKLIDVDRAILESSTSRRYAGRVDSLFRVGEDALKQLLPSHPQNVLSADTADSSVFSRQPPSAFRGDHENVIPTQTGHVNRKEVRTSVTTTRKQIDESESNAFAKQIGIGGAVIFAALASLVLINLAR